MGILQCEQNFRGVWIRNKKVRAEIGHILRTHTHAAKLVVEMGTIVLHGSSQLFMIHSLFHLLNPLRTLSRIISAAPWEDQGVCVAVDHEMEFQKVN